MPVAGDMRNLAYFVVLSLAAHLLIVYGVPLQLPHWDREPPPLEVRLQPAPPPPPVVPQPRPRVASRPAAPEPAAAPILVAPAPVDAPPVYVPAPPAAAAKAAVPAAPPATEENRSAPKPALARRLPRKGEITYALSLANKFNVGRTLQSWVIDGDRYHLISVSETTGLAALFSRQHLEYVSDGRLTAGGLRPDFFAVERRRAGKTEAAAAKFDWHAMTATLGSPQQSVALPGGAQDIVSFMYQLGLTPLAPGRIELPVTNGWKLERYELDIGTEERLETPFGTLRAVPIRQVRRPGEESIELWLAPEYCWLPVRIRFFDRQGAPSGEQLVSDIRVSSD